MIQEKKNMVTSFSKCSTLDTFTLLNIIEGLKRLILHGLYLKIPAMLDIKNENMHLYINYFKNK